MCRSVLPKNVKNSLSMKNEMAHLCRNVFSYSTERDEREERKRRYTQTQDDAIGTVLSHQMHAVKYTQREREERRR